MSDGQFASVWMPQWYMTRFPDNMAGLSCGKMVVRPMPLFEAGGFTTTMGGGTGTAVTDQTPEAEQQLAKDFVTFAKLTKEGQTAIWTDLGFDPYRNDVYDDPALQAPDAYFSGEVTFETIKSEFGNVAPEFTGPQYPRDPGLLHDHPDQRHRQQQGRRRPMPSPPHRPPSKPSSNRPGQGRERSSLSSLAKPLNEERRLRTVRAALFDARLAPYVFLLPFLAIFVVFRL